MSEGQKQPPKKKEEKYDMVLAKRGIIGSGGRSGRPIKVETNYLKLNLGNLKRAIHYDVALEPDRPKGELRRVMEEFRLKNYPKRYPAFDGVKNLYRYVAYFVEIFTYLHVFKEILHNLSKLVVYLHIFWEALHILSKFLHIFVYF